MLLICTMNRLCCGYEWDLFTLLVTMWLTLPRPFAGRFHGSSRAWNSALVVRLVRRSWNGAWGEDVCLSQDHSPALFHFCWPREQSGKHVAHCNEYREAFLKKLTKPGELQHRAGWGERLPVYNLSRSTEIHCQGTPPSTSKHSRFGFMVSCCPLLSSEALTCKHNIDTWRHPRNVVVNFESECVGQSAKLNI